MVVVVAAGCHLCDAALEVVAGVCGSDFATVDITGDAALEARYRERIPVVEVDGEARFVHFVHADALRAALEKSTSAGD